MRTEREMRKRLRDLRYRPEKNVKRDAARKKNFLFKVTFAQAAEAELMWVPGEKRKE